MIFCIFPLSWGSSPPSTNFPSCLLWRRYWITKSQISNQPKCTQMTQRKYIMHWHIKNHSVHHDQGKCANLSWCTFKSYCPGTGLSSATWSETGAPACSFSDEGKTKNIESMFFKPAVKPSLTKWSDYTYMQMKKRNNTHWCEEWERN